jgi:hypothetical protein
MALNKVDAKIRIKRGSTVSEVPTVAPSSDHTDGSWSATDIYDGEMYLNTADDKLFIRSNTNIVEIATSQQIASGGLDNRIVVTQSNVATTLGGIIDSTKEYFIDGIIDLGTIQITVPENGMTINGYSFDLSGLTSSENSYSMFISGAIPPDGFGSGNLLMKDLYIEVTGTGSEVFNLVDHNGFNAVEMARVNFNNCTSLGTLDNYRQGLEVGTGRFGGTPTLTLANTWLGGYRITTSIVRSLSAGMTTPLFKEGTSFTMNSRFLTDINCDLPTSAAFTDFQTSNFPNESTIQFKGAIITRNGTANPKDTNILPNLSAGDVQSEFINNIGIPNTYIGGKLGVTSEAATTVAASGTWYDINATTFTGTLLQHFQTTGTPGELEHIGINPIEFDAFASMSASSTAGDELELRFNIYDSATLTWIPLDSQVREVNNFTGGRDVAFFTLNNAATLNKNDKIKVQVKNNTAANDVTIETTSFFRITER